MKTILRITLLTALLTTAGSTIWGTGPVAATGDSASIDDCAKKRARGRKCDDDDNRNGNSNGNNNSNGNRNSNNNSNSIGNSNSNGNSNQ